MDFDIAHLCLSTFYAEPHFDIKLLQNKIFVNFLDYNPKSLTDWQKKNDNNYLWARKLGMQRELFDEYLSKSEITQGN